MIGVQAEPGDPGRDPQSLERPHARGRGPAPEQVPGHLGQQVPGHDQVNCAERARAHPGRHPVEPRGQILSRGTEHREHRVVLADVGHLDSQHEPHGLQELHESAGGSWFGVEPQRSTVVGQRQVVFHMSGRAEDEGLSGLTDR